MSDIPWIKKFRLPNRPLLERLSCEIDEFYNWIRPTETEVHIRLLVASRFQTGIELLWPGSKIILIGSSTSRTFLPNGDLDFVVFGSPSQSDPIFSLNILKDFFISKKFFSSARIIDAKVPIIKAKEKTFNFSVDISFENVNGILNIPRIRNTLSVYPQIYKLLFPLKVFLMQHNLDSPFTGGLSSNTLFQMILAIIQLAKPEDQKDAAKLLLLFFRVFGQGFNYFSAGLSTRFGGRAVPVEYSGDPVIYIEDPQNPDMFLGTNGFKIKQFKVDCQSAYRALYQRGNDSFLLSIFQFPLKMTQQRQEILERYEKFVHPFLQSVPLNFIPKEENSSGTGVKRNLFEFIL